MSICATVRTSREIEPKEIFDAFAKKGERIVVVENEFPNLLFGNYQEALRGVEVNKEENGYEVRICTFASGADYKLFATTVQLLKDMTNGSVYEEDDDGTPVEHPSEHYGEEWANSDRYGCFSALRTIVRQRGCEITLFGLFSNICIGPKLLNGFGIALDGDYYMDDIERLQHYLISVQWLLSDKKDTSTRMVIPDENNENRRLSISAIVIEDNKVEPFDYISSADLFGIFDLDKEQDDVLIPMKQLWKILPKGVFHPLDDLQYARDKELTVEMTRDMIKLAERFQPDDLCYMPTKPGQGYDERQNTFILMWNPAISSVTLKDHNQSIPNMLTGCFNWSVWDYEKAKVGDRFFMVRVGEGKTGIVMSGTFTSMPYEDEDWSGKGRQTFYMDMEPNVIINPDEAPMLTTAELQEAVPSFDWTSGHSGRILTTKEAIAVEQLWNTFIEKNEDMFDGNTSNRIE